MSADPRATYSRRRRIVEQTLSAIAESDHRDRFALRGGWAFMLWQGDLHRATEGIDLADLGGDEDPVAALAEATSSGKWAIAADWRAAVVRRQGCGWTAYSRISVVVGVAGEPVPARLTVASLPSAAGHVERLRLPSIRRGCVLPAIACLSREWMVAEKLALLVTYGPDHTRQRDVADLWELQRRFAFGGCVIAEAWRACAAGRDAEVMLRRQDGYWKAAFSPARIRRAHRLAWERAVADASGPSHFPDLAEALAAVARFALPVLASIRDETAAPHRWVPGDGWSRSPFPRDLRAVQRVLPLRPPDAVHGNQPWGSGP